MVEGTHEPLIDQETFDKVRRLVDSRKHTRSRTYDFLLKGLIFCHECGYPLAVLNRKNAKGEDVLYFVCRTYQRFTKAGVCTCHSIKEQVVTQAVVERVREVCRNYLQAEKLLPIAKQEIAKAQAEADYEKEITTLKAKIDSLSAHLDQVYLDKLSGLLDEADFQRVYRKVKADRPRWSSASPKSTGRTSPQKSRTIWPNSWWNAFWLPPHQPGGAGFPIERDGVDRRKRDHPPLPVPWELEQKG